MRQPWFPLARQPRAGGADRGACGAALDDDDDEGVAAARAERARNLVEAVARRRQPVVGAADRDGLVSELAPAAYAASARLSLAVR